MSPLRPAAAFIALACLLSPAIGSAADNVDSLRKELQALKSDYDQRVRALEQRIETLETASSLAAEAASAAPAAAPPESMPQQAMASSGSRATGTAFNPAMSLILGGNYTNASEDPATFAIAGFVPSGGEAGPGERSFSLGESELTLNANVDPYFYAQLTAAISGDDEIGVEEAFFRTLALPAGLTAKGGRFFSGFGYLNEVHAHAWDFVDQPLVYQAFFGNQRAQDGLQVKWLAPTDLFIELGAETGNGDAFPGTRRNRNGFNGATLFGHVGGDIGDSTSWRAGVSWLDLRAEERAFDDTDDLGNPVVDAFTGNSRTWVADAVFKWTPYGTTTRQQLKVQAEYMRRKETGALAFDVDGLDLSDSYSSEQTGWYVQTVYQFMPRWRAGVRYDALDSGTPRIGLVEQGVLAPEAFPGLLPAEPDRLTMMLDWNPSEFSRLRAQYAWDNSRDAGDRDRQFHLQYIYGIGAHGAHKY